MKEPFSRQNVIQTTERTTQTGAYSVYTNARGFPAVRDYVDYSNYQDYSNYRDSAVVRDGALLQDARAIGRDFRLRPYASLPNVGIYRDVLASPEVRVSRLSLPYASPRIFGDYVVDALKPAVQVADSQVQKVETSISSQTGSTVPVSGELLPQVILLIPTVALIALILNVWEKNPILCSDRHGYLERDAWGILTRTTITSTSTV